jgi:Carboxypeptidase regulatory-like domain/TonB-dependent Receptor Plug Domain
MRFPRILGRFVCMLCFALPLLAQSPNGNINGQVLDPSNGAISAAEIVAVDDVTGVQYTTKTNGEGLYVLPNLPPGTYRLQVSKVGFKTLIKPDIVLNVQDALSINFTLPVGALHEIITIEGGAPILNTESAAVSTVIDQNYVANMPLNGRSFQDLILLTPGVTTNSPQTPANFTGEFSVNGQRTESNYYTVDGVSANTGVANTSPATAATSGSLPASTALGTTQGLVSIDALDEFRVQSSTYSAEYGRNPGGQFAFSTRSGTNQWHGTAFDYLRNNVFDANDWFNDYYGVPEPAERQNDFGGTLGGPVEIPGLFDGKNSTFFFFSYEGLRLDQPQAATLTDVPDANLRASTPAPLGQVLNGFPLPTPGEPDLGNGLAEFIGSWTNPSNIDSTSVRLDRMVANKLRLFFRFSNTSSDVHMQDISVPSVLDSLASTVRTYTLGATSSLSARVSNEFRLNFSSNEVSSSGVPGNFGGATAVNLQQLQGLATGGQPSPLLSVGLYLGDSNPQITQYGSLGRQRQWNVVNTLALSVGRHQLKFGVDFRRLDPVVYQTTPVVQYFFLTASSVMANSVDEGEGQAYAPAFPTYTNFSAFTQDDWKLTPHLNLSMGLRWEVNPAPGAAKGNLPYTVEGSSLATLSLAPQGTPLWRTDWFNLAPRFGAAYVIGSRESFQTVVRGGGGVFFDTGQQLGSYGYQGPGFSAVTPLFGNLVGSQASFPEPVGQVDPVIVNPPVAPYTDSVVYAFPSHLQLPYTLQWNLALQQALGKPQALTVSYVGARGRRLLEQQRIYAEPVNPNFSYIVFSETGLTSDYDALQIQFQRRLAQGLQALASYTWGHAIDYGSQNASLPYLRGSADFDVRQNFTSALSYDIHGSARNAWLRQVSRNWGLDDRFTVRSGFPVTLSGAPVVDPSTGRVYNSGLDLVPGQPLYVDGAQCAAIYANGLNCPGGRAINPNAFALPAGCTPFSCPAGTEVGNAPRNFVRGFGAWQMDVAVRREFPIKERLKLQFRAEAFNIFNHPNFGTVNSTFCAAGPGCTFGQATATLAQSLGTLSPLYQMGGPRSAQFALKLMF